MAMSRSRSRPPGPSRPRYAPPTTARMFHILCFLLVVVPYFNFNQVLNQLNLTPNLDSNLVVARADAFTTVAPTIFINRHASSSSSRKIPTTGCIFSARSSPSLCSQRLESKANRGGRHYSLLPLRLSNSDSNPEEEDDTDCYDLIVIGAGPVGVKAALLAANKNKNKVGNNEVSSKNRVALIDAPLASGALYHESKPNRDLSIGGPTGLYSKALRDSSKRINVESLRGMGLREDSIWNEITGTCVDLATWNSDDAVRQLEYAGVTYIEGLASFVAAGGSGDDADDDDGSIVNLNVLQTAISGETSNLNVRAKKTLIATGSKPFRPSNIPFDGYRIFDSDSINQLSYLPSSIAITGSGIIAIEFAKIFRNLGSDVTLIIRDGSPRNALMKIGLDIDVSASLVADLVRSGINIERGAQVASFDLPTTADNSEFRAPIRITLEPAPSCTRRPPTSGTSSSELRCDAYLAAVGRIPNTGKLRLDAVGIDVDDYGGLIVDTNLRTTAKGGNVYGAGDVLGRPFLASTGVAQAVCAIQTMFEDKSQSPCSTTSDNDGTDDPTKEESCTDDVPGKVGANFDPKSLATNPFAFPTGIWSSPEAAYYGLSKQQAIELDIDAGEGVALYSECLRGLVFNPNGLLKLVHDKGDGGRIIGVHICGDDACELIHYGMELVKARRTVGDVANELYSAVTYHEMYRIAALAAIDVKGARKRRAAAGTALAARNRAAKKK